MTPQPNIDVSEDAYRNTSKSTARQQLSIKYNGVAIYQSCIDTLRPQGLLNDNIVSALME
jgi:hypothetical protein